MVKYRSRLQIIADILSIIGDGSKKTRIMYRANLSYKLLCRYLDNVLDAQLAESRKEDSYVLTPKGEEFLAKYAVYSKRCTTLEEHMNDISIEKASLERMCLDSTKNNRDYASHKSRQRTKKRNRGKKSQDLARRSALVLLFILLFALSQSLATRSSALAITDPAISDLAGAEEAITTAYQAVLQAEEAGADVSALLTQLNVAADHLSKGRQLNSTEDLDETIRQANEVKLAAAELKDSAVNSALQRTTSTIILSVVAVALIAVGGLLFWSYLKGRLATRPTRYNESRSKEALANEP